MLTFSVMSDSANPWTIALQVPLSVGFSRQEYCNGLPFPSPGDLPDPGTVPGSPALHEDSLSSEPPGKPILSWHAALIRLRMRLHSQMWKADLKYPL